MPEGVELKSISQRYNNISTGNFWHGSHTTTVEEAYWYNVRSSYEMTVAKADNTIRLYNDDSTYIAEMVKGGYIRAPFSDSEEHETMIRSVFVMKSTGSIGFGITTGLGADEGDLGSKLSIAMRSTKLKIAISDTDTELWENMEITDGASNSLDHDGPVIGAFDPTIYNIFEIRAYFIRGEGNDAMCRAELLINNVIMDQTEFYTDAVYDLYSNFALEVRPFVSVWAGKYTHLQYVGVFRQ